ncbi:voltage-dependent calcium channel subunit alpha-2/delta-3 isoform X1 [Hydra vulgaris]|uniref:voltage-dependent calcium channel subunit alpha-2/delta-3 isoform X1 n=1 Tax=Hydra vulgaris TaxID=6087 RepID=UPI001F5FADB5|nr:voltage-dependent calcium channel subunit alpha-2/delta-3-like [Hydra vulgaris]
MKFQICIIIYSLVRFVNGEVPINLAKLTEGAFNIWTILDYHINKMTNYKKLNDEFKNISESITIRKVNTSKTSEKFISGVKEILATKEMLLKKLKENVTALKNEYSYDEKIDDFDYPTSRNMNVSSDSNTSYVVVVKEFPTDVAINRDRSFVHVPTNIYEKNKNVLNVVKWTENLDDMFIENQNIDNATILQYYCDKSGILRMYPGNLNGLNETSADLYDCRRRLWYQQSSASPKDVVIIIDRSGSMTGNNIAIATIAAKSIIDTLEENDYFNVISAGNDSSVINQCNIDYLIQATKFNKERIKKAIDNIGVPKDVLNIPNAIEKAFNVLYSGAKYNRTYSAGCNKLIMLLSDSIEGGYSSTAKSVFDKWNSDKSVRVFTYLVGRTKNPVDRVLKEMACNNRGHFYKIETLGNIWDTVIKYMEVISRPIGPYNAELKPKVSPIYLDSTGAGMVLTMSVGVFINGNLSGVVGVDMLIRSLKQKVPVYELGYFSHTIIINNNGFVILHPKNKIQNEYLPLPPNVYFEDIEFSVNKNDAKNLKERMLKGENGSSSFTTYWVSENYRMIVENNITYYFSPINGTNLFASLAMSDVDINYIELSRTLCNDHFARGLDAMLTPNITENGTQNILYTYVDIPPWDFCNIAISRNDATVDVKVYPNTNELQDFLKSYSTIEQITESCEENLVSNLLVSASLVFKHVNESWYEYLAEKQPLDPDFTSLFVGTRGGYTRYFFINSTDISRQRDLLRVSIFEEAVALPKATIILSTPTREIFNDEIVYIKAKASSWIDKVEGRVLMAVTGTDMNSELLKEIMFNVTDSLGLKCLSNNTFTCALIDQNGYIVASNQGNRAVGQFFGAYHAQLMEFFSKSDVGVFRQIAIDDVQAICTEPKNSNSNSNYLLSPAKTLFRIFLWFISLLWSFLVQTFTHVIFLLNQNEVFLQNTKKNNVINITCTEQISFYLFQNDKREELYKKEDESKKQNKRNPSTLRILCANGKYQYFELVDVPNTNLIFIVVNSPDANSCFKQPTRLRKQIPPDKDFCNQEEAYRLFPGVCYNQSTLTEELPEFCGAGELLQSSIVMFQIIFLCFYYTLS